MGKASKQPTYNPPTPPTLPTADELFSSAGKFGQSQMPQAYGAREGALTDLSKGNAFYDQFQPTSFEQALGNQYFQNVAPDMDATIKNGLSMAGIESSPVLSAQLGKAHGDLGFNIGQYLSGLGNQRAQYSLSSRMGIDPMVSILQPYANMGQQQGNAQANLQYDYQQQMAQAQLQQELAKQQQSQGLFGTLGTLGGAGLGALLAAPTGGMSLGMGALLGGLGGSAASPLFGGGANPQAMSALMNVLGGMGGGAGAGVGGASSVNPSGMFNGVNMPHMGSSMSGAYGGMF